jgi:5'-methylthioadenosine nucleosidase
MTTTGTRPDIEGTKAEVQRIGFIFAMRAEGEGLVKRLGLKAQGRLDPDLPAVWFSGRVEGGSGGRNLEIAIAFAGEDPYHGCDRIGTLPATLAAYLLCRRFRPDLLVNAGTCGGFQREGASIGAVYVGGGDFLFHDRRIPLPKFDAFGIGRIPAIVDEAMRMALGAESGVISTGDSFEPTAEEQKFFERERVTCKEMEAASIASLSRDLGIRFLAVKAVTDLVDHPEPEKSAFARNLNRVSEILEERLIKLLEWMKVPE